MNKFETPTSATEVNNHPSGTRGRKVDNSPMPASGAWHPGLGVGNRKFYNLGELSLESGQSLPETQIAYETWGQLNTEKSNAILVLHALTGDSHVTGPIEPGHLTPGWWQEMVGPGAPIDTEKYFVVAPNVIGGCQGSTGPASERSDGRPWGGDFPLVTVRDQVQAEVQLAHHLQISDFALVIGMSMGGHRALEWAFLGPEHGVNVSAVSIIASGSHTSADQIAWAHTQIGAIKNDPNFNQGHYYDAAPGFGPHAGIGLARQIAHITYRSAFELDHRFGRIPQGAEEPLEGGRFAVQSYLDHHGQKLARRFDANSYLVLTQSMLTHDVGRGRGGIENALKSLTCRALVVAVDSDRLFLPQDCQRLADLIPNAEPLATLHSDFGHDGFLIEFAQLGPIVADFIRSVFDSRR